MKGVEKGSQGKTVHKSGTLRNRTTSTGSIDERTGSRKRSGRRPMPKNALPVWKTADPTFGAPSAQSLYCSCFVLVLSVAVCMPELVSALGRVDKSWFGSYISYAPQLGVLSNIVLTFFSIYSSRYCMSLSLYCLWGQYLLLPLKWVLCLFLQLCLFAAVFRTCNGDRTV